MYFLYLTLKYTGWPKANCLFFKRLLCPWAWKLFVVVCSSQFKVVLRRRSFRKCFRNFEKIVEKKCNKKWFFFKSGSKFSSKMGPVKREKTQKNQFLFKKTLFFKKKIKIYHLTLIFSNIYLIFYLPPLKPVTIYDPL